MSKMEDRPTEMIHIAMTRAKMCELLAEATGVKQTESYFTAGMFSALDILMEQPLKQLLDQLPLSDEINDALNHSAGKIGEAIQCAHAAEKSDYVNAHFSDFDASKINELYMQAVGWTNEAYGALS